MRDIGAPGAFDLASLRDEPGARGGPETSIGPDHQIDLQFQALIGTERLGVPARPDRIPLDRPNRRIQGDISAGEDLAFPVVFQHPVRLQPFGQVVAPKILDKGLDGRSAGMGLKAASRFSLFQPLPAIRLECAAAFLTQYELKRDSLLFPILFQLLTGTPADQGPQQKAIPAKSLLPHGSEDRYSLGFGGLETPRRTLDRRRRGRESHAGQQQNNQ